MEVGSGSFTESRGSSSSSQPNSSTESLNGLKFGQKIYFEDLGLGAQSKSGGRSSSSAAATPPKKVRGNGFQAGQPPRCQVEGCNVDLSDAKAYYSRHKVCGMHSKSPKVIVAGLEQRFCQQCSRFHLLPEFDQGKRSCRRRLAGHNERRRKPQPRSLSSMHYSRLSSSFFGNTGKVGSFLIDFSSYPKLTGRDLWSSMRSSEQVPPVDETNTATGKYYPYLLQKNSENSLSSSDFFLQGSSGGHGFSDTGMPSGECITGVTDSSCALSLLSNQPWSSENRTSSFGTNGTLHAQAATTSHVTNGAVVSHFPATSWAVKTAEAIPGSHEMTMDLGLCQMAQPQLHGPYTGEVELPQLSRRQYMEYGYSRTLDSTQQMHWSL